MRANGSCNGRPCQPPRQIRPEDQSGKEIGSRTKFETPLLLSCRLIPKMQTPQNNPGTGSEISRRCPVCGQDATTPYLDKNALHLVRCTECSMIYANPAPADFACGQFYMLAGAEYYLDRSKLESDYAPVRFQRELRFFRKHCETGS